MKHRYMQDRRPAMKPFIDVISDYELDDNIHRFPALSSCNGYYKNEALLCCSYYNSKNSDGIEKFDHDLACENSQVEAYDKSLSCKQKNVEGMSCCGKLADNAICKEGTLFEQALLEKSN